MALKVLDITRLLDGLARERPVFHSEADFQFALAWRIKKATSHYVRLEFKPFPEERVYLDIWLPDVGVAIELKYPTSGLTLTTETSCSRFATMAHRISANMTSSRTYRGWNAYRQDCPKPERESRSC